jgi:hypothetical protein
MTDKKIMLDGKNDAGWQIKQKAMPDTRQKQAVSCTVFSFTWTLDIRFYSASSFSSPIAFIQHPPCIFCICYRASLIFVRHPVSDIEHPRFSSAIQQLISAIIFYLFCRKVENIFILFVNLPMNRVTKLRKENIQYPPQRLAGKTNNRYPMKKFR